MRSAADWVGLAGAGLDTSPALETSLSTPNFKLRITRLPFSDSAERWRTIPDAARRLKLKLDSRLVVQLEGDGPVAELGYGVTRKLLARGRPLTAVFALNDLSAFGAIGALHASGLRVPEEVSVVGFDDILGAASHNPPLTTRPAAADGDGSGRGADPRGPHRRRPPRALSADDPGGPRAGDPRLHGALPARRLGVAVGAVADFDPTC